MKFRHLATAISLSGLALLGAGASLLRAQAPQPQQAPQQQAPRQVGPRPERTRLRAEVVRLRTEVEMARFDYELAREVLLEELKISRGLKLAGGIMGAFDKLESATNQAQAAPGQEPPPRPADQERKKVAEAAEIEEKKEAAQEAAAIAEAKKELTRLFHVLEEKRLDLDDAEYRYRDTPR